MKIKIANSGQNRKVHAPKTSKTVLFRPESLDFRALEPLSVPSDEMTKLSAFVPFLRVSALETAVLNTVKTSCFCPKHVVAPRESAQSPSK